MGHRGYSVAPGRLKLPTDDAYTVLGITVGVYSGTSVIPAGTDTTDEIFEVSASSEGTWGNSISIELINRTDGTIQINVWYAGVRVEQWANLKYGAANVADDNYVEKIINGTAQTAGSDYITILENTAITGEPKSIKPTDTVAALIGGQDGIDGVTDADYIGVEYDPVLKTGTGINAFLDPEKIDINLLAVPGISSSAVVNEMLSLCGRRGDVMCVVDPPYGLSPREVIDWHNGQGYGNNAAFNSSYGALYHSWMQVYDTVNKQNIWLPPSGYVLAQYALTDVIAEPWFAPAGLTRGRMLTPLDVEVSPSQGERDQMYGNGNAVNPIVNFVKDGITIWGQRTLQRSSSALDRVNVRRLLLYLRKIAANSSRIFVFEPSDPITWRRVRELFDPLLADVQARRGISEYRVVCDETINTPARVDRNELWCQIYIKPIKSAEVIQIDFVLLAQGATVEESLA